MRHRFQVLGTRKTMREHGIRQWLSIGRQIQFRRERFTRRVRDLEILGDRSAVRHLQLV